MAALLAALIAGWLPCPWPVCRWIPLVPEPIATYADYRALLAGNRSAGGRVASRRPVDCEAVRQDVARRFRAGERLLAEPEEASPAQQWLVRNGLLDAWITGATLHLRNTLMETPESVETWRTRVERLLTRRPEERDLLAGLFRALVLHGRRGSAILPLRDTPGCVPGGPGR
jgi:hypothetical protein